MSPGSTLRLVRSRRNRSRHDGGWTLIELMIVVAVITALTVTAVPAYRSAMWRAHRVEATSALAGIAAAQERFHLQYNTYADDLGAPPPDGLGLAATTTDGSYALAITSADAATFSATATAQGRQSGDTHCAEFAIDATGARTATNGDCW